MAKKKKKKQMKKDLANHDAHHQAIHDTLVRLVNPENAPEQRHLLPLAQPWHMPAPWCFCRPTCVSTNPLNGSTIWRHPNLVH